MGNRLCRVIGRLLTRFGNAVGYRVLVRLIHHPVLLRAIGRILRKLHSAGAVASNRSVTAVFERTAIYSSLAHGKDLPRDIEFVIGMEAGPTYEAERDLLERVLGKPRAFGDAALQRGRARAGGRRGRAPIGRIAAYLVDVGWGACGPWFGAAASDIESYRPPGHVGCPVAALYSELRYVGAQLIGGALSPEAVKRKADEKAVTLNARVASCAPAIAAAWSAARPVEPAVLQRNAVGLMWVGHPATVQAGALLMQSLLDDPTLYRGLREAAERLGDDVWTDSAFRAELESHVVELLRFRPPFPILNRMALRDGWIDADGSSRPVRAGATVGVLTAAALFDGDGIDEPARYWPGRPAGAFANPDNRYLMFGLGERSCIAKQHVIETLVGALTGLMTLGELRYAKRWSRIAYDGPIITGMSLRFV